MMKQYWKKVIWAATLTVAFAATTTACTGTDLSTDSAQNETTVSAEQTNADNSASEFDAETTSTTSEYSYSVNDDGTISITSYNGSETELNLPDTIDGYIVSGIADHAFEANWDITSVTMPNGLSYIGESAFMDCGSLTTVSIPETVATVRRAAFASCSCLTEVTLPASVDTVNEEAFTGCGSLTKLTIMNPNLEYDSWGLIEGSEPLNVCIASPSGSAMEAWADENGFATEIVSE